MIMFPVTYQFNSIWPFITNILFSAGGAAIGTGLFWAITNWFMFKK